MESTPTGQEVDERLNKWPIELMKQRYLEGKVTLDEFESDVEYYITTGRFDSKYAGHIPDSVKA